jgi:hypothetical protein
MMLGQVLLSVLVLLGVAGSARADVKILDWSFDRDAPGSFPAGFVAGKATGEAGRWEVTIDPKATSLPHVLALIGPDQAGAGPQVIFIEGAEAGNLDLTVRIKAVPGGSGQGGGFVFRAQDDRNYYVVWLSPEEKLIRLEKVVDGGVTPIQDLKVESAEPGKWHTLRVLVHGAVMEAIFENSQVLSGREDKWQFATYKKGKVGLWARGGVPTYFDTIRYINMDDTTTTSGPFGGEKDPGPPPAQAGK